MLVSNTSERLKYLMETRKLKQVDILNLCFPYSKKYKVNIRKNYLSQYVSGKVQPNQDKLSILAMALDVSEAWLMGYDVPMKNEQSALNKNDTYFDTFKKYVKENSFTDEELEDLLNYAKFLISKRDK